jgi:alkanesulfonate monooxygenase SsuD/methylene tetrahydromethanopterin reductase-like flavin-dependent oxidoreductase (luciferase family)
MERLGKDRNPYRAGFLQFVGVAESREEAMRLYKEPAEYFYGRCLHVDSRYVNPPGYNSEATQRAKITSQVALASQRAATFGGGVSWEEILDKGFVIIGSPDEVAEQLKEVATDLNVGHLMMLLQFGNMGRELSSYNTRLFAEKVMPQLRGLFDDRWQDRWWPKPLPKPARVVPQPPAREAAE